MYDKIAGGANTFISYAIPKTDVAQQGDLWWSSELGRMFIYFVDGDSSQWVAANPIGIRPLTGATSTHHWATWSC